MLEACYLDLANSMRLHVAVLLHSDDVSDRLLGVLAGYLVWSKKVETGPGSIALIERLFRRSLGPEGREILMSLPESEADLEL